MKNNRPRKITDKEYLNAVDNARELGRQEGREQLRNELRELLNLAKDE